MIIIQHNHSITKAKFYYQFEMQPPATSYLFGWPFYVWFRWPQVVLPKEKNSPIEHVRVEGEGVWWEKCLPNHTPLKEIHCPHNAVVNGSHGLMVWSMFAGMRGNNQRRLSHSHFSKLMVSVLFICVIVWLPSVQHGAPTVQFASPGTVIFDRYWNTKKNKTYVYI